MSLYDFMERDGALDRGIDPWYVLSCLWDGAYNRPLVDNWKEYLSHVAAAGFLFAT